MADSDGSHNAQSAHFSCAREPILIAARASDRGRMLLQTHSGHTLVEPYVEVEWEYESKYSAIPITASLPEFPGPDETFYVPAEGQDSAVVSAGVSVQRTPRVSSYVGYDGQLGRGRYDSNAVTGGVRVSRW
jgi:outer membrane autotransporter protein